MATNGQGISEGGDKENRASERAKALRLSLEDRRRREGSGWVCVWRAKATSTTVGEPGKASLHPPDSIKKGAFFPPLLPSPPFVDPTPNFETTKNSKAICSGRPVVWLGEVVAVTPLHVR